MGTTYYVDPAGSNTSPYDTWAKAATALQTVADIIVAGDTCYCKGLEDLAATVDFDTAAATGSNAGGYVKFIGCNAAGNVDGTRFALRLNNVNAHGITMTGAMDLVWLENIEIYGAGTHTGNYDGITITGDTRGLALINCSIHNMGRTGVYANGNAGGLTAIRSTFYLNGANGIQATSNIDRFFFCSFHDNIAIGATGAATFIGCLSYDNGDDGFDVGANVLLFNCTIDQNADDGVVSSTGWSGLYNAVVIGCRITNQSGQAADIGFNASTENILYGWNYIFHNGDNIANSTLATPILVNGVDTNTIATEDSGNVDLDGYTSVTDGSEDYNLASDALHRRTAVTIPLT